MAREKRQIGTITKCGTWYEARPSRQPGKFFRTSGEARSFFRQQAGSDAPQAPQTLPAQPRSVSFQGNADLGEIETAWLTANWPSTGGGGVAVGGGGGGGVAVGGGGGGPS